MDPDKIVIEAENIALRKEVADLRDLLKFKDDIIRAMKLQIFGPKSDKLSPAQAELLFKELSVTTQEVEKEAALPEAKKNPSSRKPHPGRNPFPEHLPRVDVVIRCDQNKCSCPKCGTKLPEMGFEVREELACKQVEYFVKVIKRQKLGSCPCHEGQGVTVAPAPAQIVPKGKLSTEFIVQSLAGKYQQHLPIYRQCANLLENHGIYLSRNTVTEAVLVAGDLLRPVVRAMAAQLLSGSYIQADETKMPCQVDDQPGRNHQAYMWEFSDPGGIVIFEFHMGRGGAVAREFLQGFRGKLQSDGYPGYDDLGEGIIHMGCMAHARRYFTDASKLAPLDPLPKEVVKIMKELYRVEGEARDKKMNSEERLALRKKESKPIMERLKARVTEISATLDPSSKVVKACKYTLGQWTKLEVYLEDGRVEIDNNWCEGAMRPLVLGRKNWLHVGSEEAGPKIAAIASIVETCRRLDVNLIKYLNDVLPKLGDWDNTRVAELTPMAWKATLKS
ncbi:MAG: transposase [Variovorax sp.]|nr:transposase [Variovorax sp.]